MNYFMFCMLKIETNMFQKGKGKKGKITWIGRMLIYWLLHMCGVATKVLLDPGSLE
jgi:hypothetical protein